MRLISLMLLPVWLLPACGVSPSRPPSTIDWQTDRLAAFCDAPLQVEGSPTLIESPFGQALLFDGLDDALVVDCHPLEGATEFTVELLFRPDSGGAAEQRVLHLQQDASKDRILLETRLVGANWFMDSYIKSDDEGYTLFSSHRLHPLDQWFHLALVVDGERMAHFVDGRQEMVRKIEFLPPTAGRTSLGVRINRVDWFRGAVRRVRFTPRALAPAEFFQVDPYRRQSLEVR